MIIMVIKNRAFRLFTKLETKVPFAKSIMKTSRKITPQSLESSFLDSINIEDGLLFSRMEILSIILLRDFLSYRFYSNILFFPSPKAAPGFEKITTKNGYIEGYVNGFFLMNEKGEAISPSLMLIKNIKFWPKLDKKNNPFVAVITSASLAPMRLNTKNNAP